MIDRVLDAKARRRMQRRIRNMDTPQLAVIAHAASSMSPAILSVDADQHGPTSRKQTWDAAWQELAEFIRLAEVELLRRRPPRGPALKLLNGGRK